MAPNSKQLAMRKALEDGFLNEGSPTCGDFGASVLAAGYSRISLITRSTRYKRWIEEARRERGTRKRELQPKEPQVIEQWSPVSGRRFMGFSTGAPAEKSKPAPESSKKEPAPRFEPEKFFHPTFGECFRSANGCAVPTWVRHDDFSGGDFNASSLPMPGTDAARARAWAQLRADQDRFARSYQTHRDAPLPPQMLYTEDPSLPELDNYGTIRYPKPGEDVTGDAAAGKFGIGRVTMRGE